MLYIHGYFENERGNIYRARCFIVGEPLNLISSNLGGFRASYWKGLRNLHKQAPAHLPKPISMLPSRNGVYATPCSP
jgi:hypothetical protein